MQATNDGDSKMELLDALAATFDHTGSVIAGVRPDQLDAPTPCADWAVRDLLAHTVGVVTNMGCGVRGEELLADVNATNLDADLGAQFRAIAASTLAAWRSSGLDGEVNVGAGPMPAMVGASINLLDTAAHSWDIARATGQPEALSADLAAAVMGACQMVVTDEVRGFAGFSPAVPVGADASPTHQIVAFLGRQP